jgi:hypothetical protein
LKVPTDPGMPSEQFAFHGKQNIFQAKCAPFRGDPDTGVKMLLDSPLDRSVP